MMSVCSLPSGVVSVSPSASFPSCSKSRTLRQLDRCRSAGLCRPGKPDGKQHGSPTDTRGAVRRGTQVSRLFITGGTPNEAKYRTTRDPGIGACCHVDRMELADGFRMIRPRSHCIRCRTSLSAMSPVSASRSSARMRLSISPPFSALSTPATVSASNRERSTQSSLRLSRAMVRVSRPWQYFVGFC